MLIPGPEHPITLDRPTRRWRAAFAGHVIADTDDAIIVREADLPAVVYFPREAVDMAYMSKTDRTTHCPYKGDASYYTLLMDGNFGENAVWSYEDPFPAMSEIAGRLAFYTDKVEVYSVDDAAVNPHHHREHRDEPGVDQAVLHTDAGDGRSQREPWPPNVANPANDDGGLR